MARYPIKQLKDKNELPFFPFNTLESVLVDGTDQNLADVLNNIYTKAEVNTMFATELSKFSVYPTQADLPSTAREGAVAATNENNVYLMYMYYSGAWRALTQKGDKGDTGAVGPTGPTGPTGPAGRDGAIQYTAGEGIDITNNTISVTNGAKVISQNTNIKDLDPGVYICNGDYKLYWSSDAYIQPKGILEVASHSTPTSRNFSIITKNFSYQSSSSSGGSLSPHLFVGEAPSNFTPTIKRLDTLASDDVATAYNKGLMSSTDKTKLNGISAGAEVNVQSDWNESDNTSDSYIQNKPTVPTKVSDLDNDSGFIDNTVNDLINYTLATDTGHSIDLSINTTTYVMTLALKNSAGTTISTDTVDLPLESVVVNGTYDSTNKKIILTLQSGSTIDIPVGDLVSGLQTEITSSNKLSADLVDDTSTTNKFVTASDKTTWNGKQDGLVSGTNIKTINNTSLLGSGNIEVASIGQLSTSDYNTSAKALVLETLKPGIYYIYNGGAFTFYIKSLATSTGTRNISIANSAYKYVLIITKTPTSNMSNGDHIGVILTNTWGQNGSRWGSYLYTLQYSTLSNYGNLTLDDNIGGVDNLVTMGGIQTISGKKTFSVLPESSIVPTTDNQLVNKKYVDDNIATKQDILVSGTDIKTINNTSILGSGNIDIQGGGSKAYDGIGSYTETYNFSFYGSIYDTNGSYWSCPYSNGVLNIQTSSSLGALKGTKAVLLENDTVVGEVEIGDIAQHSSAEGHINYTMTNGYVYTIVLYAEGEPATKKYVDTQDATKQNTLVSGTNIKTINGVSVLGSGNIEVASIGQLNTSDYNTSAKALVLETLKPGIYHVTNNSTNNFYIKALNSSTSYNYIHTNTTAVEYTIILTQTPSSSMSDSTVLGEILTNKLSFAAGNGSMGIDSIDMVYNTSSSGDVNLNNRGTTVGNVMSTTGVQTVSGKKTFSTLPESSVTPTNNNQLTNKTYVDSKITYGTTDLGPSDTLADGTIYIVYDV